MSSELGSALWSFCDKFRFKFFQQLASTTWIDFRSFVVRNNSRLTQTNPRSSFDVTTRVVVAIDIGNVLVSTSVSARSRVGCCPRRKMVRPCCKLSVPAQDLAMPQFGQSTAIRDPVVLMYQLPLDPSARTTPESVPFAM